MFNPSRTHGKPVVYSTIKIRIWTGLLRTAITSMHHDMASQIDRFPCGLRPHYKTDGCLGICRSYHRGDISAHRYAAA
jgi:hypothetical protein